MCFSYIKNLSIEIHTPLKIMLFSGICASMKEGLDHGKGHGNFPTHKMFFLVKKEKKKRRLF